MKSLSIYFIIIFVLQIHLLPQTDSIPENSEWETFPILNYDHDAGFGYGGKGFLFNFAGAKESFDIILFNSTEGERWYRFVFSVPDFQRRHGKKYSFAVDLSVDYDKWISYKYYSPENVEETYTREPFETAVLLSRGITENFVMEGGLYYKSISSYGFTQDGILKNKYPHKIEFVSLALNLRFDTRDNPLNAVSGYVVEITNELARDILTPPEGDFYKSGITGSIYSNLFKTGIVLASRGMIQFISSENYLTALPLGGNKTIRGLPQDRYLSESLFLMNNELRFPIYRRLGGIAGVDIGNSGSTPGWIINPVAGLRFYMDNFVVRFDAGFGGDDIALYFNFGQVF